MQRIGKLLQASMFLNYMWQKMRVAGAPPRWESCSYWSNRLIKSYQVNERWTFLSRTQVSVIAASVSHTLDLTSQVAEYSWVTSSSFSTDLKSPKHLPQQKAQSVWCSVPLFLLLSNKILSHNLPVFMWVGHDIKYVIHPVEVCSATQRLCCVSVCGNPGEEKVVLFITKQHYRC